MTRTPPAATYDDDFFTWTQDQAAALRGASATLGHGVDIEHVAEEIADSGKRDLREVSSFVDLIFEHLAEGRATASEYEDRRSSDAALARLAVATAEAPPAQP